MSTITAESEISLSSIGSKLLHPYKNTNVYWHKKRNKDFKLLYIAINTLFVFVLIQENIKYVYLQRVRVSVS